MSKVVLDPGHGGYDPGAVGPTGLKEKDVTLAVALKVATYLHSPTFMLVFTRMSDQVPWPADEKRDLAARCSIADACNPDLFVSIHCNSAADRSASGTETFYYPGSAKGKALATAIQAKLVQALGTKDRGVKENAGLAVLRGTKCPAVLAELAFISNPQEEKLLGNRDFQEKAARAIAGGIADYLGVSLPEPKPVPEKLPAVDGRVKVVILGASSILGLDGYIIGDRAYAPVRALAEALGCKVEWDEQERVVRVFK